MTTDAVRMELAQAQTALKRASDLLSDCDAKLAEANRRLAETETALVETNYRLEATQMVITALLASVGWFGLKRRRFRVLVSEAGKNVPDDGPVSVMHHVLLAEGRKVLDLGE